MRGQRERGTRVENRKTKPFRRRLGNGTSRSAMASGCDFLAHRVTDCEGAATSKRRLDALYIFRFGCGNKKTIRSRDP